MADPGFQVREGALKRIVGVFRVKNHDFTPNKITFFPILPLGIHTKQHSTYHLFKWGDTYHFSQKDSDATHKNSSAY